MTYAKYRKNAKYCERTFGSEVNTAEDYFTCPECGEPLYYDDYTSAEDWEADEPWTYCPVCMWSWLNVGYLES